MSGKFRIAETRSFQKSLLKLKITELQERLKSVVYPEISTSPLGGSNIKKLKGKFQDLYRFRIGDFRLFYIVDEHEKIVYLADIQNRKDAYKKRK